MSKVRFSRVVLVAFVTLSVSACSGLSMPDMSMPDISMPDMPSIFSNKTSSDQILIPRDEYGNPILPKS